MGQGGFHVLDFTRTTITDRVSGLEAIALRCSHPRAGRFCEIFCDISARFRAFGLVDQASLGKAQLPLSTKDTGADRLPLRHFMNQGMKVRQPAFMSLRYQEIAELRSGALTHTLQPKRDFPP